MLRLRVLTALALIPLVMWAIWLAPPPVLPAFAALVLLLGAWEWSRLMGLRGGWARGAYTLVIGAALLLGWVYRGGGMPTWPVIAVGSLWWLLAPALLRRFSRNPGSRLLSTPASALVGLLVIVPTWFAVAALHQQDDYGAYWLTVLLLLVWGSDIGAYAVGRRWGRRRLAPALSPGKTWEGAIGGMVLGVAAVAGMHLIAVMLRIAPAVSERLPLLLVVVAVAIGFGIVGDLFESMMKRQQGLKDSGSLLPGHGGMLDRIDALLAASPIFAFGLWLVGGMHA